MSGKMKRVFLKSAILTVAVFLIGLYVGIMLDSFRLEEVKTRLTEIDNLWNDVRLLQQFLEETENVTPYCNSLLDENLKIGDRIYSEGVRVEEYERTNRFADFLLEKRRYALLDVQFWINSIKLKEMCNANYSTVIYFYSQYNKTPEQRFQDGVLWDLKQKCGPTIIYITFPADLEISTLEIIKDTYNIKKIPSILINESIVLESPVTMREIQNYVKC